MIFAMLLPLVLTDLFFFIAARPFSQEPSPGQASAAAEKEPCGWPERRADDVYGAERGAGDKGAHVLSGLMGCLSVLVNDKYIYIHMGTYIYIYIYIGAQLLSFCMKKHRLRILLFSGSTQPPNAANPPHPSPFPVADRHGEAHPGTAYRGECTASG